MTLLVDNPNEFPLTVVGVSYSAILEEESAAEGEERLDLRIEAAGPTRVTVPLSLRPDAFLKAGRRILQSRKIDYEFNGSVTFLAPVIGTIRIPFSRRGSIDAVDLLMRKGFGIN